MATQTYQTCDVCGEKISDIIDDESIRIEVEISSQVLGRVYVIKDFCKTCHKKLERLLRENNMLKHPQLKS